LQDYENIWKAEKRLKKIAAVLPPNGLSPVPDELLPPKNTNCFRIPNYGMKAWKDVSTSRQKLALVTLSQKVRDLIDNRESTSLYLEETFSLVVSRCSDFNSSLNSWAAGGEFVRSTFARQALSMVWDFCEVVPLTTESGGYDGALNWVTWVIEGMTLITGEKGQVQEADACSSCLQIRLITMQLAMRNYQTFSSFGSSGR